MTYGKRKDRGGLKESLETSKLIMKDQFDKLMPKYRFYGIDKRVKQILFIANDMTDEYTWLYIQLEPNEVYRIL